MDYEKAYKDALGRASGFKTQECKDVAEYIFPELKESEDEQHRKWILEYLYDGLRKADEQFKPQFASAIGWLEKQDGQKHTDKVEPRFHKGDWISNGRYTKLIVGINSDCPYYMFNDGTSERIKDIDKKYHLWSIADAKDGDVLLSSDGSIFIFKEVFDLGCKHYIALAADGTIQVNDNFAHCWESIIGVCPATKEQRNLLFQKMKEANYKWDTEKVVPIFNIGDTIIKKHNSDINKFGQFTITDITGGKYWYNGRIICDIAEQDDWEFVEQNSSWSKEDESKIEDIVYFLNTAKTHYASTEAIDDCVAWLKSLKQRI